MSTARFRHGSVAVQLASTPIARPLGVPGSLACEVYPRATFYRPTHHSAPQQGAAVNETQAVDSPNGPAHVVQKARVVLALTVAHRVFQAEPDGRATKVPMEPRRRGLMLPAPCLHNADWRRQLVGVHGDLNNAGQVRGQGLLQSVSYVLGPLHVEPLSAEKLGQLVEPGVGDV